MWRLIQAGMLVASGDDLSKGHHYALIYNQDGAVHLEELVDGEWVTVLRATKGALVEIGRWLAAGGSP